MFVPMRPLGRLDEAPPGDSSAETAVSPPPPRSRHALLIGAAVLVLALTAFLSYGLGSSSDTATPRASASPKPSPSPALTTAQVYEALAPSIVLIQTVNAAGLVESTGTGVVANAEGLVLTALHVVKGGGRISLTFADGTQSAAEVAGSDPEIDIAVLVPEELPAVVVPAKIGNSGRLGVGDDVVAIGNQLGLTGSTTSGVVSGLNRSAESEDGVTLSGLIQFDAAVNPGSSGGPLVNTKGETIGIVVALANPTEAGTFVGVGFAVPIGTALGPGGAGPAPQQ